MELSSFISNSLQVMQNDLLLQLTERLAAAVETSVSTHLSRHNSVTQQSRSQSATNSSRSPDQLLRLAPGTTETNYVPIGRSVSNNGSELENRPEKIGQIINNWKLRFSGGTEGLSVDNFIYRVEALTHQTLGGNFALLCDNASLLFEGKANDFYWRFHKAEQTVRWNSLCMALRKQFRDTRSDVDIRELIRNRKQKEKENFDGFYDAVVQLVDRLEQTLDETTLVEILRRNLRPEVQHEILNIETRSVSKLREVCRKRECFLDEARRVHGYQKSTPFKRNVAEVFEENKSDIFSESDSDGNEEIGAMSLICWNCRREGHRYQDCVAKRKVFCYGCGTKNTYKPACPKCQKNLKVSTQGTRRPSCVQINQATNTD
ncbi:uncharacterized protein LOC115630524 [Scaptodrosophila lebanonensis]|uniref:Uncharacterized protein LOC115630524 n=1 Tax=Drosophila lebanonensis TaxID=7225 RepID=A0A6J2U628_DROLE|nr:uncharacterized protein LOC115630524 [Scaptodrosophila lebanonensis]